MVKTTFRDPWQEALDAQRKDYKQYRIKIKRTAKGKQKRTLERRRQNRILSRIKHDNEDDLEKFCEGVESRVRGGAEWSDEHCKPDTTLDQIKLPS